jgi:hypothetical protein
LLFSAGAATIGVDQDWWIVGYVGVPQPIQLLVVTVGDKEKEFTVT